MGDNVVTIYCCGTCSSRANKGTEAVAYTWDKTTSRKLILDGPGSVHSKMIDDNDHSTPRIIRTERIMKAVESGQGQGKNWLGNEKTSKQLMPEKFNESRHYKAWRGAFTDGGLKGEGTADNVIMAIEWLWEQYYVGKASRHVTFDTINLVGWSRGAVTCVMIAHAVKEAGLKTAMQRDYGKELKINIFAFDPVPGAAHDFEESKKGFDATGRIGSPRALSDIVGKYRAVLMQNEGRFYMTCVSFSEFSRDGDNSRIIEYPLPGEHSDAVSFAQHPAGDIALHLCHKFLGDHGTDLAVKKTLNNDELIEKYSALRLRALATGIKPVSKDRRGIIANTMRDHPYFINGHHYELFKTHLAQLHNYILTNSVPPFMVTALRRNLKNTIDALEKTGLL